MREYIRDAAFHAASWTGRAWVILLAPRHYLRERQGSVPHRSSERGSSSARAAESARGLKGIRFRSRGEASAGTRDSLRLSAPDGETVIYSRWREHRKTTTVCLHYRDSGGTTVCLEDDS